MPDPYVRERIENWAADFCGADALRDFSQAAQEHAGAALTHFLCAACDARELPPDEIEESDAKAGLLALARLNLPPAARDEIPALCGAFLASLEADGRLGGGRALGAYVRALREAYLEAASGKFKPDRRPGSRIGRNDPCPCGSGRKYKKCCMGE